MILDYLGGPNIITRRGSQRERERPEDAMLLALGTEEEATS